MQRSFSRAPHPNPARIYLSQPSVRTETDVDSAQTKAIDCMYTLVSYRRKLTTSTTQRTRTHPTIVLLVTASTQVRERA